MQERSPTIDERQLKINLPQQANFSCIGDRVLIGQAVANLLDIAIRFCNNDGQIDISLESLVHLTRVSLLNQGPAIPDFAKAKLYHRFFSLPPVDSTQMISKSSGLDLSFVEEIMKLNKGKIEIANISNGVSAMLSW